MRDSVEGVVGRVFKNYGDLQGSLRYTSLQSLHYSFRGPLADLAIISFYTPVEPFLHLACKVSA